MKVKVLQDILGANETIARRNRELLDKHGILAVNIMSSPGAGKTSLILQTITNLKGRPGLPSLRVISPQVWMLTK